MSSESILQFVQSNTNPLIVILGPTASGKTGYSISLAHELEKNGMRAEVVNADSRQVYKYLDIGTAKITTEEMDGVPHHLLDILDPKEELTAAWYKTKAMETIDSCHGRGVVPLLVGGSMLYISAVTDNFSFTSPTDSSLRTELEDLYDTDNGKTLFRELEECDPETASITNRENRPYVVRAVEIFRETGEKASVQKLRGECPYNLKIIGIQKERKELCTRIEKRIDTMFEQGWMEEVQDLIDRGYKKEDPGMKSHGYREIMDYLALGTSQLALDDVKESIASKTRHYAKRQMTWWRRDERIEWVD